MVKPKRVFVSLVITPVCSSVWSGNFSVGVEAQDYLPISEGEGGMHSGYAKDLLDAFAAKYGHSFTYKPLPVYRLLDEFAIKKSVDFKLPGNTFWAADAKKGIPISYSKVLVAVTKGMQVLPVNKGK